MASARWERPRTELRSVRSRVLATTLGLLAAALLLVGGLTHYLRLVDLDATAEEPFTDVAQLFCTFMTTTVPGEHESILVLVDGEPAFEHAHRSRFQLDAPATVAAVAERARPGRTVVFDHEQDGRALRLGVISVRLDEDPRQGYLVVGFDMSAQRDIVLASLWRYLVIAGLAMVVAGPAACVMVGRVTAPVTRLRPACVCTFRPRRRGLAQQLLDDLLAGGPPAGEGARMFSCPSHAVPGHRAP